MKRSKNFYILGGLIFELLLASRYAAFSLAANEGAHGAHSISKDGQEWLRDLVDKTTCIWKTGDQMAIETGFLPLLNKIKAANQYFGELLEQESHFLKVCLAEQDLKPVPEPDQDIFLPYHPEVVANGDQKQTVEEKISQIAVRINLEKDRFDTVFVDSKRFKKMPADQEPFLWLHELSHGFIPEDVPIRMIRLRSFVSSLYSQREKPRFDPKEFLFWIDASKLELKNIEEAFAKALQRGDWELAVNLVHEGANPNTNHGLLIAASARNADLLKKLLPEVDLGFMYQYFKPEWRPSRDPLFEKLYFGCEADSLMKELFGIEVFHNYAYRYFTIITHTQLFAAILALSCPRLDLDTIKRLSEIRERTQILKELLAMKPQRLINDKVEFLIDSENKSRLFNIIEILAFTQRPELAQFVLEETPDFYFSPTDARNFYTIIKDKIIFEIRKDEKSRRYYNDCPGYPEWHVHFYQYGNTTYCHQPVYYYPNVLRKAYADLANLVSKRFGLNEPPIVIDDVPQVQKEASEQEVISAPKVRRDRSR